VARTATRTHIQVPCDGCSTDSQRGGSPCKLWSLNGLMVLSCLPKNWFLPRGPRVASHAWHVNFADRHDGAVRQLAARHVGVYFTNARLHDA